MKKNIIDAYLVLHEKNKVVKALDINFDAVFLTYDDAMNFILKQDKKLGKIEPYHYVEQIKLHDYNGLSVAGLWKTIFNLYSDLLMTQTAIKTKIKLTRKDDPVATFNIRNQSHKNQVLRDLQSRLKMLNLIIDRLKKITFNEVNANE